MKKHRKWKTILVYCKTLPISKALIAYVKYLLTQDKNVLIMIKKEEDGVYTAKEKFDALCEIFPNETKTGKIIVSAVPDITEIDNTIF